MQEKCERLPDTPGIYLFYDAKKELVYVGKATSLRSRVSSYFRGDRTLRPIEQMMHDVADISWQETDSVLEAIILEANMIKKYLPKYNVEGKDDKSWNYIAITKDPYPRVETIRQREYENNHFVIPTGAPPRRGGVEESGRDDKMFQHVFGPYPGLNTKATMKILRKIFSFSTCQNSKKTQQHASKRRPCFYYQMGQCLGVCTGEITPKEYRAKVIRPLVAFLSGRKKALIRQLEVAMRRAAKAQDFEEAARLRNQISSLQRIQDIALLNKSFVSNQTSYSRLQSLADSRSLIAEVRRIEGYDISNLGPTGVVGSMVVFMGGEAEKKEYRKFRIRGFDGQSDVDALEEVMRRRLRHTEWPYPQLFLIDGGLPQVNRVKKILDELRIPIPVVGIAKGAERKRNDIIFAHDANMQMDANDANTKREFIRWVYSNTRLLIAVRDEAHRFAIAYQRTLRKIR